LAKKQKQKELEKKLGQIQKFLTQNPRKLNVKVKLKMKTKKIIKRKRTSKKSKKKKAV